MSVTENARHVATVHIQSAACHALMPSFRLAEGPRCEVLYAQRLQNSWSTCKIDWAEILHHLLLLAYKSQVILQE